MNAFQRELNLVRHRLARIRSRLEALEDSLKVLGKLHEEEIRAVWLHGHDVVHDEKLEVKKRDA